MKTKYLLYFLFCLLLVSCSEDKGNYNYTPINEVVISGIKNENYIWRFGTKLEIPVTLKRSLEETTNNLAYSWEIDGKVISTKKDLQTEIPAGISYGDKECRFSVTDKANGMTWSQRFKVSIVSEFGWGYYFLTEKEDHSTVLSYLPISGSTGNGECLHSTTIAGLALGKYPRAMPGRYKWVSALKAYMWTFQVLTKEGEFPVIMTNNIVFDIMGAINSNSFMEPATSSFKPEWVMLDGLGVPYYISEGKIICYVNNLLYRPAKHNKEYHWSHPVEASGQMSSGFFFDDISKKYYNLTPQPSDATHIGDPYALDLVTEFQNNRFFGDEAIIGSAGNSGYASDYSSEFSNLTIVSTDNGDVYLTDYYYYQLYKEPYTLTKECLGPVILPLAGVNKNSKALLVKDNWYVTAGNSIYTSPKLLPKFTSFIDIPEEVYGKIVNIGISAQNSRLIVTTYQENSPEEMKGSVILIDIQTKKQYPYKNIIHRCVDLLGGNAQTGSFPLAGDGK